MPLQLALGCSSHFTVRTHRTVTSSHDQIRGYSRSKGDKEAFGEETRDMVRRRRSKKKRVVSENKAKIARRVLSYRDLYEDWLEKQVVKSREVAPEVRVPTDTFEGWIQERVRKRISQD